MNDQKQVGYGWHEFPIFMTFSLQQAVDSAV